MMKSTQSNKEQPTEKQPFFSEEKFNSFSSDQIYDFFEKLIESCRPERVYSVIEMSEKMGVPYKKVKEWANLNPDWDDDLQACRCLCACHAHDDWAFFKLPYDLGIKYCLENDDEFAEHNKDLIL